ncbi:MFS transporter [Pseudomonas protegens]|uniref:MFS transporter n=1 Tax=Pseudomonas protegens TaxID=380021 RepID=UPI00390651E4
MADKHDRLIPQVMLPLFCVVAIDAIGMGVILPLLPFYSQHFGASSFAIGALVAVFSLGQFVAAPILGRLSDRYGRKPVLLLSQAGTLASLVMLACAGNLLMVFLARILDGLTSGNIAVASAYAVDHSSPGNRRRAIGAVGAAIGVGMMCGPMLAAFLSHISMSAPVWAAAALALLSIGVNAVFLPAQSKPPAHLRPDKRMTIGEALKLPGVASVLTVLGMFYFAFAMYISQFALFLQERYQWDGIAFGVREVGVIFAASGAINIFVQVVAIKKLEKWIPDHLIASASLALFAVGLTVVDGLPGMVALASGLVLASVGTAVARPSLMASLSLASPQAHQGAMMGVSTSLMAICMVIGPLGAGLLIKLNLYSGWALSISAIMLAAACFAFLFARVNRWPKARTGAS